MAAIVDSWPLTAMQQGILFHAEYDPQATDVYRGQTTLDFEGQVDLRRLRRALQEVTRRHPPLRSCLRTLGSGQSSQVVLREVTVPWTEIDLTGADTAEVDLVASREWLHRFDLGQAPLLRVVVIRRSATRTRVVITMHHILCDGWSIAILVQDLITLYEHDGDASALPPVPPHSAYLSWLSGRDRDAAREAWRSALAGSTPTLVASGKGPDAPVDPAVLAATLPGPLVEALRHQARRLRITHNTLLRAAWAILLGRLTGRADVLFGTTTSGRPPDVPGMEHAVGMFINTLPVRARWDERATLGTFLARLLDDQAVMLPHEHLGLAEVQQLAGVRELFDTLMVFQNFPMDTLKINESARRDIGGGVQLVNVGGRDAAHFPLVLNAMPDSVRLTYRPDLFDRDEIEILMGRLLRVLEQVAGDPRVRLWDIDVLTPEEHARVRSGGRSGVPPIPEGTLLPAFREWVRRAPDAVALRCGDQSLSYADLAVRVDRLARFLVDLGVHAETRVGLCLPRGIDMVVALLAVWQAGGAYVPLDPEYPTDRLGFMVDDSGATVVLATGATASTLPPCAARLVLLERVDGAISAQPAGPPQVTVHPDQLAYVIYTSGSTGRPKGVAVCHRGVAHLAHAMRPVLGAGEGVVALQFASFSFDAAVLDVAVTLAAGGVLAIASEHERRDPNALADMISAAAVRVASVVPSLLTVLDPAAVPGVVNWVVGSERVTAELAARWAAVAQVWNAYGPTEATVISTVARIDPDAAADGVAPPIGSPIGDTRVYLLDGLLHPVPTGVTGEVYLGGPGLARGYLGRPALTAERFVASPFDGEPGRRLYRTGDLARWTADGQLSFVGRVDDQIKIRGFRIEPGEVESVLAAHPDVRQAVVVARLGPTGERCLVGYVVPTGTGIDARALHEHVARYLPEYMVPAIVVPLDALPLSPNGKVDRASLPAPGPALPAAANPGRTPREEVLCSLFAQTLDLPEVGAEDSFFTLGGDSLTATRLASRVRAVLGAEVSVRMLFEAPSPALLAKRLDGDGPTRPPLVRAQRPDRLPMSFGQRRMWFVDRLAGSNAANTIALCLRLHGDLDPAALVAAWRDVVDRHETLRTVYGEAEGTPYQRILDEVTVEVPMVAVAEDGLRQRLRTAVDRGFDLTAELPWRATLYATGPADHVLLVVMHHIAADGWSLGVLTRDLSTAYTARLDGRAPGWSPLPVQYADFTLWQQDLLRDEDDPRGLFGRQLDYWTRALADLPSELDLPLDRARPAAASHRGLMITTTTSASTHDRLRQVARACEATMSMVSQAALAVLLHRLGAGEDIPFGTPLAGRVDEALDGLVGYFLNTLVLRTDLRGNPTFADLVRRVREADLAAYAHQDLPFDRLVEVLNPQRSLSRQSLFQIGFAFQNTPEAEFALPGLEARFEPFEYSTAKFDLSVIVRELRGNDGGPGGLAWGLEYATDLFEERGAQSLTRRLVRVLEQVAAQPSIRIADVDVFLPGELARLAVAARGATASPRPGAAPTATAGPRPGAAWDATAGPVDVPAAFARTARRHPDRVAVLAGQTRLTYRELDARAGAFARFLADRGVRPGDRVAVALPRSPQLIVVLLGVARAGAACVPVDPAGPAERTASLISSAAPAVVVTEEVLAEFSATTADTPLALASAPLPASAPFAVMYTSGSTGTPKGVVTTHGGVVALAADPLWGGVATGRMLFHAPHTFDAATLEIWVPLLNGGSVVVAPPGVADADLISALVADVELTTVHLTAGLFRVLAQETPACFAGLRHVLTGGDVVPAEAVARVLSACPEVEIRHLYGPTETTMCATIHTIPAGAPPPRTLPLGRPRAGVTLHVLDDRLRPVPTRVPGELYIEGSGVALGYLGQPELTAQRFVATPGGGPMYRTGDLVRWSHDDELEFLGRTDDQVKIRGYRVEPAEVAAVLGRCPEVAQVGVVAGPDPTGSTRLVAYVVAERPGTPIGDAVRRYAVAHLPEYMHPAATVEVDRLPVTANGKLDRAALPAPEHTRPVGALGPRTGTEHAVHRIWSRALGRPQFGVHDKFFDIGGTSLHLMVVRSELAALSGADVPVAELFEHSTIATMAAMVDQLRCVPVDDAHAFQL